LVTFSPGPPTGAAEEDEDELILDELLEEDDSEELLDDEKLDDELDEKLLDDEDRDRLDEDEL
jgi:hypothetical protein